MDQSGLQPLRPTNANDCAIPPNTNTMRKDQICTQDIEEGVSELGASWAIVPREMVSKTPDDIKSNGDGRDDGEPNRPFDRCIDDMMALQEQKDQFEASFANAQTLVMSYTVAIQQAIQGTIERYTRTRDSCDNINDPTTTTQPFEDLHRKLQALQDGLAEESDSMRSSASEIAECTALIANRQVCLEQLTFGPEYLARSTRTTERGSGYD